MKKDRKEDTNRGNETYFLNAYTLRVFLNSKLQNMLSVRYKSKVGLRGALNRASKGVEMPPLSFIGKKKKKHNKNKNKREMCCARRQRRLREKGTSPKKSRKKITLRNWGWTVFQAKINRFLAYGWTQVAKRSVRILPTYNLLVLTRHTIYRYENCWESKNIQRIMATHGVVCKPSKWAGMK